MRLLLTRLASTERGTLGILEAEGLELWTMEQPWRENRPFQSCVPIGSYSLKPHSSHKYPDTYALVGETVSHQPDPNYERFACLIHIGNIMDDVSGCIAVGIHAGFLHNMPAVLRSRPAMGILRRTLGRSEDHTLMIRQHGIAL